VSFTGCWLAGGSGGCGRGPAVGAAHSDPSPLRVGSRCGGDGGEVEGAEGGRGEEGGDLLDVRAAQGKHVDGALHELSQRVVAQ
jgi:hypothetical protein